MNRKEFVAALRHSADLIEKRGSGDVDKDDVAQIAGDFGQGVEEDNDGQLVIYTGIKS